MCSTAITCYVYMYPASKVVQCIMFSVAGLVVREHIRNLGHATDISFLRSKLEDS